MTSLINPQNIDITFPVAGQNNSSQGFRDNFTNIKNNLAYAKSEIDDLQSKAIVTRALTGQTLDNDMSGAQIKNAAFLGSREVANALSWKSNIVLDFSLGSYQTLTAGGSTAISFSNWPAAGAYAKITLAIIVTNTVYTLTVPGEVSVGLTEIAGASGLTITFDSTGTYLLEFSTSDGGATVAIKDTSRNNTKAHSSIIPVADGTYDLGSSSYKFNSIYANTLVIANTSTTGTSVIYTGNVTANTITANTGIYGNIKTAAQTQITSVGTLTSLTVAGNLVAGNASIIGSTTQSGSASFSGAFATPVAHTVIANGSTTQLASNVSTVIVEPSTDPIAAATVQMPATPVNGQRLTIGFGNAITAITHSAGAGQVLKGALSGTVTTSSFGTWIYYTAETTWYRIG